MLNKDHAKIELNVQKILGHSPDSAFTRLFKKQVMHHQLICGLETLRAGQNPKTINLVDLDNYKAAIQEILLKNKGLIIITGHLGCWELIPYASALATGRPLAALAKPPKIKSLARLMEKNRNRLLMKVLWTDQKTLVKDMLGTLADNHALGLVMDQKAESRKGITIRFLGYDAEFVAGPARTATRTGAPVMAAFCIRTGPMCYRMSYKLILDADHGSTDEVALTQIFADEIGRAIEQHPHQWVWNYRRWQFQP